MKYIPPFGFAGETPYVNGNPAIAQRGSIPPAEAIEHPMREIVEVIAHAGMTPSDSDLTQLRQAIISIFQSLSGAGDTSDFVTMTLARARLPIFPEILTADGRMNVSSPGAGSIQVPSGVLFAHRGIYQIATSDFLEAQRTFATTASKVYHLRWRPAPANFVLLDLADVAYNPTAAAETDARFDSSFDDMLIARVVTNSSNVATITNLANGDRLSGVFSKATSEQQSGGWDGLPQLTGAVNFARTPAAFFEEMDGEVTTSTEAIARAFVSANRYVLTAMVQAYIVGSSTYISGKARVRVTA